MSQAKVDRYKQEKANRKKIMAKEKLKHNLSVFVGCLVLAAIVGWAGYSAYNIYENNKPTVTTYANLDSINDYLNGLTSTDSAE